MRLIGKTSRFAVGYELDANYGGEWMYGKFCFFCNEQEIGDYEVGTSLRDVLFQLDEVTKFKRRANQRFNAMTAKEVFEMVDAGLSGELKVLAPGLVEEEQWRNLCLFPAVDVFDGWKGFLLRGEEIERLIFSVAPYEEVKEAKLNCGEFDGVIECVRKELNEIYEREINVGF
jgi:hypothetical protein